MHSAIYSLAVQGWVFIITVFAVLWVFWTVMNWTADLISKAWAGRSPEAAASDGERGF